MAERAGVEEEVGATAVGARVEEAMVVATVAAEREEVATVVEEREEVVKAAATGEVVRVVETEAAEMGAARAGATGEEVKAAATGEAASDATTTAAWTMVLPAVT